MGHYIVEQIIDKKVCQEQLLYLVKWRDKPLKEASWETQETLKENQGHIELYENKQSYILSEAQAKLVPIVITIQDDPIKIEQEED